MRRLPLRSPPRVRGKVPVCCPEHRKVRITPAYAGKRDLVISGSGDIEDHPRVCGEKLKMPCWIAPSVGSPPRMRGKAGRCRDRRPCARITPACAGKSIINQTIHYHTCGSPPRMRGKEPFAKMSLKPGRITPAYAGKSTSLSATKWQKKDHPRVCGEKLTTFDSGKLIPGSPPRMRGKVTHGYSAKPVCRITPAYAGKRSTGVQGPRPL